MSQASSDDERRIEPFKYRGAIARLKPSDKQQISRDQTKRAEKAKWGDVISAVKRRDAVRYRR
jgi:hypothetical protein